MIAIERRWLVIASLGVTALTFVFFILAPLTGYPLSYPETIDLIKIIVPIFMGYLGTAAQSEFSGGQSASSARRERPSPLFRLLVRGPIFIFAIMMLASVVAFGVSNTDTREGGMSIASLSAIITVALALLAVTTSAAVSYLFRVQKG